MAALRLAMAPNRARTRQFNRGGALVVNRCLRVRMAGRAPQVRSLQVGRIRIEGMLPQQRTGRHVHVFVMAQGYAQNERDGQGYGCEEGEHPSPGHVRLQHLPLWLLFCAGMVAILGRPGRGCHAAASFLGR